MGEWNFFSLFVLYFSGHVHDKGGLAGFSALLDPHRRTLGALGDRQTVLTSTSVSRFLGVVEPGSQEAVKRYLLLEASGGRELLKKAAVVSRDGVGSGWHIFDLDPTSMVLRQRALPDREDLPAPHRRSREAKPGYLGRKRGEVKVAGTTLLHAGSGLWLGVWAGPGNGDFPHHRRHAFAEVAATCEACGIARSRALIRMDGEGDRTPAISDCQAQQLHYLARSSFYTLLSHPEIRTYLNEMSWYEVEDSGSGPVRYGAELGQLELPCSETSLREDGTPYAKVMSRVVVSRYRAQNERGSGILIEGWKYELYATDLEAEAYVAPEVVTLYYARSGVENRYGQEDRELGLERALSFHLPGYELACAIGLFMWNLRICWGLRRFNTPEVLAHQVARRLMASQEGVKLSVAAVAEEDVAEKQATVSEKHPGVDVDGVDETTGWVWPVTSEAPVSTEAERTRVTMDADRQAPGTQRTGR